MYGMNYGDVELMTTEDRAWYLNRLQKQLKKENDALKKSAKHK